MDGVAEGTSVNGFMPFGPVDGALDGSALVDGKVDGKRLPWAAANSKNTATRATAIAKRVILNLADHIL